MVDEIDGVGLVKLARLLVGFAHTEWSPNCPVEDTKDLLNASKVSTKCSYGEGAIAELGSATHIGKLVSVRDAELDTLILRDLVKAGGPGGGDGRVELSKVARPGVQLIGDDRVDAVERQIEALVMTGKRTQVREPFSKVWPWGRKRGQTAYPSVPSPRLHRPC